MCLIHFHSSTLNLTTVCHIQNKLQIFFHLFKTKEFIKENFDLFGDLVEYVQDNMNMVLNPFSEPEKAHVWLLLEASQSILSKLPTMEELWNDEKELTPKLIKQLTKELKALNIDDEDLF